MNPGIVKVMAKRKITSIAVDVDSTLAQTVSVPGLKGLSVSAVDNAIQQAMRQRFKASGIKTQTQRELQKELASEMAAPVVNVKREASRYSKDLEFEIELKGDHYSGLTNQQILELFKKHGRDFTEDNSVIRSKIEDALLKAFDKQPWDDDTAAEVAEDAIRDWIVFRVQAGGVDVVLPPLSAEYLSRKLKKGEDSRVGIKKGKWLKSLQKAKVIVTPG